MNTSNPATLKAIADKKRTLTKRYTKAEADKELECKGWSPEIFGPLNRNSYGFEIVKDYYSKAKLRIDSYQPTLFNCGLIPEKPKNESR